jgi:ferritin
MISEKMQKALNEQINKEIASGYMYLAMAAYLESEDYPGAARWMRLQAAEENGHAMRLFDHIVDRNGKVVMDAIEKPAESYGSLHEVFKKVLEHERKVTASIHSLYELARKENDYAAEVELQWFITEQVEEEKTTEEILRQLDASDDRKHILFMIDRHLGKRRD